MSSIQQEKPGKRQREPSSDADNNQIEGETEAIPIRENKDLFCSSVTINCALGSGCIPCAYKVCCFDVALDSVFSKMVPNQRPESCPRAKITTDGDNRSGEILGYKPGQRVLTVGDGDFSFSLAVAKLLSRNNTGGVTLEANQLVATSYESRDTLQKVYPNFDEIATELNRLGAILCFTVDATRLVETLPASVVPNKKNKSTKKVKKFDRIVWNFPCTAIGKGQDGQNDAMDHNKQLVRDFVENGRRLAVHGGEMQMCHKTKPPFNQWKIEEVALEHCENKGPKVRYEGRIVLDRCLLPPYQPRKALDAKSFPCHDACFYVFQVSKRKKGQDDIAEATIPNTATQFDVSSETRNTPGLYPVSSKLICAVRGQMLAHASASKRNKQNSRGKQQKRWI